MGFVYAPEIRFAAQANPSSINWQRLEMTHWTGVLQGLIQTHVEETQSRYAAQILNDWPRESGHFWQIVPKEMLGRLEHPLRLAAAE